MTKGTKYTYPLHTAPDVQYVYRLRSESNGNNGKRSHLRINHVSSFMGSASNRSFNHWIVWYRQVVRFGKIYVIYKLVRRDMEEEARREKEHMEKFNANGGFKNTPENILKVIRLSGARSLKGEGHIE